MSDSFPARRLQSLLHEHIPLAREMGAEVRRWDDEALELEAPLGPNLNHHGTFFGGSASALAILAGWGLVHLSTLEAGLDAEVVIQRVAVRYSAPAPGPLVARAARPDPEALKRFVSGFRRRGLARMRVRIALDCGGIRVATVDAAYAAIRGEGGDVPG